MGAGNPEMEISPSPGFEEPVSLCAVGIPSVLRDLCSSGCKSVTGEGCQGNGRTIPAIHSGTHRVEYRARGRILCLNHDSRLNLQRAPDVTPRFSSSHNESPFVILALPPKLDRASPELFGGQGAGGRALSASGIRAGKSMPARGCRLTCQGSPSCSTGAKMAPPSTWPEFSRDRAACLPPRRASTRGYCPWNGASPLKTISVTDDAIGGVPV